VSLAHLDVVDGWRWVLNVAGGGGNSGKSIDEIGHVSQFWHCPSLVSWVVCM
jgi:hypothetical protein